MYKPLKLWLEENGYNVFGEVLDCDIVGVKNRTALIIEMKKSFTAGLLIQLSERKNMTQNVYAALPSDVFKRGRDTSKKELLLKRLGCGLLTVDFTTAFARVEKRLHPSSGKEPLSVREQNLHQKRLSKLLGEIDSRSIDLNVGGSSGVKLVTSYKEQAIHIACVLEKYGPLKLSKLLSLKPPLPAKTVSILSKNYYGWFNRVCRGVYELTSSGCKELDKYEPLTQKYRDYLETSQI